MLVEKRFGNAGTTVVLEDRICGQEASVHAITDGERYLVLPPARDHKRVGDGDVGPNTGGMGAVAPAQTLSPESLARIETEIVVPTLAGMRALGRPFRGVLFAGIMLTDVGAPVLLEHNVRFGDPECQVLTALLDGDLAEMFVSVAKGTLDRSSVRLAEDRHAITVILAADGYPSSPRLGDPIPWNSPSRANRGRHRAPRRNSSSRRSARNGRGSSPRRDRDGHLSRRGSLAGVPSGRRHSLRGHVLPS